MTLRKGEDTLNLKRKQIALCGELALVEVVDLL
jgi:hypothetical protein